MEKTKKILTYISLSTMIISVVMLILAIFGIKVFSGVLLKILLSFATIAVASAFTINALNVLKTKKVIPYVCIGLLCLSTLLGFIVYWTGFQANIFSNIVAVLAIATAFFCIIVSLNNNIGDRYKTLQIITYIVIVVIDIILSLLIFGVDVFGVKGFMEGFFVACLIAFALLCTIAILGKKKDNQVNDKFIKVEKEAYDKVLQRLSELEKENVELKAQLKK